jgi:hypothetical protein
VKTLQVNLIATDPPSVSVIMVAETEGDRCVVAELSDQAHAARCEDLAKRTAAINGRILVSSMASEVGVEKLGDPIEPATQASLDIIAQQMSMPCEELLRKAFVVRFFYW